MTLVKELCLPFHYPLSYQHLQRLKLSPMSMTNIFQLRVSVY
ncbi:histidine kinase domain protein [Serratia plymuthica A30]|nr:histidine kinase domain protein [Serratia plymuthica A30]